MKHLFRISCVDHTAQNYSNVQYHKRTKRVVPDPERRQRSLRRSIHIPPQSGNRTQRVKRAVLHPGRDNDWGKQMVFPFVLSEQKGIWAKVAEEKSRAKEDKEGA